MANYAVKKNIDEISEPRGEPIDGARWRREVGATCRDTRQYNCRQGKDDEQSNQNGRNGCDHLIELPQEDQKTSEEQR